MPVFVRPRPQGQAVGDAVQPAADRIDLANGARLPSEREEGGLEHILGVVSIAHEPAAQAG